MYWQEPHYAEAGRVFMSKHDKPDAFRRFEKALTINPRAAEVLVCKGQMAASQLEFKDAEKYAEQALKINPRMVSALCLMAEVHWFSGEIDTTMKTLEKARVVNPRDEATLARIAACHYAPSGATRNFQERLIKEARTINSKCYTFFNDLATLLEERKFYAEAEKYYNVAMEMQPKFCEALNEGAEHALHGGWARKRRPARPFWRSANKADPFNVRVNNSLLVLDHLETYHSLATKHFIIRYDKKNDLVLAKFMAVYLEDIYKRAGGSIRLPSRGARFRFRFSSKHKMFSGRVIAALPDLHTIGACTGPMVAMCSPHDTSKRLIKPFNWNRVIRHELVHVFNLEQTKSRVPHWFTEGLAVRCTRGRTFRPSLACICSRTNTTATTC